MLEGDVHSDCEGPWEIQLTGCITVFDSSTHQRTPHGRKARAILAYLSANLGRRVPRHQLIDLLWGDRGEAQARDSLRQSLAEIRRTTGDLVSASYDQVWIEPNCLKVRPLQGADAFADLDHITPEFDSWLVEARQRCSRAEWEALRSEAQKAISHGNGPSALPIIERLRAIDPYDEEWARLAMQAEFQQGSTAAIDHHYRAISCSLLKDLGLSPAAETRDLRDQLIADLTGAAKAPAVIQAQSPATAEASQPELADVEPSPPRSSAMTRRSALLTAAASGLTLGGALLYKSTRHPDIISGNGPLVVAVLPFSTETGSSKLTPLAGQLSDQLRSDLSRVTDIRMIAAVSSHKVAEPGLTTSDIAKKLGARLLIQGQISARDRRLMANLSMVDQLGTEIWSTQFDSALSDPGALRPTIAAAIVSQLSGMIPLTLTTPFVTVRPDPQAYGLVLESNRQLDQIRSDMMSGHREEALALGEQAARLTKQALAIDPNDSDALAIMAQITRNGWTPELARMPLTTKQRIESSMEIVGRALLADPHNPAALTELGDYYRRYCFRWDEAENLFHRALAINPSLVEAHWSYAYELGTLGRGLEGLDHALSVFELDPRNPFHRVALPRLLYVVGAEGAAMQRYRVELWEQPENLFLVRELYFLFLSEGNGQALAGLENALNRLWPYQRRTSEMSALVARIDAGQQALAGKPGPLRTAVDTDVAKFIRPEGATDATPQGRARDDLPFIFAIEYAWAGLPERALDMLDLALATKSLYWPPTLPFGIAQFPASVRQNIRFLPLFNRDEGLRQLLARRRQAIVNKQMAGFAPDGRKVLPAIPKQLASRINAALRLSQNYK